MGSRRLSQAIAEGAGISLLVEVADAEAGDAAGDQGADGLVVRGGAPSIDHLLPVLALDTSPEDAVGAGADAVVLPAGVSDDVLADLAERAATLGIEIVVEVRDEEGLERVLEHLDPEVILLAGDDGDADEGAVARVLELLPDVPAGKLAIALLATASRDDVEELERAGVDAVVVAGSTVASGDLIGLAGDDEPEV